jgi:hypothetical protein
MLDRVDGDMVTSIRRRDTGEEVVASDAQERARIGRS